MATSSEEIAKLKGLLTQVLIDMEKKKDFIKDPIYIVAKLLQGLLIE